MRLAEHFIFFRNNFNKFNNIGARMLGSIYHMTLKILKNYIFVVKTSRFSLILRNVIMDVIFPKICKPQVVYRFYCMALFHSQMPPHMIITISK